MQYDQKEIENLVAILEKNNLSEIELENETGKIKISRQMGASAAQYIPQNIATVKNEKEETTDDSNNPNIVKSPMVGTVYLSPSPGAENFTTVGKEVKQGDVLCLVEAMKMFNKIKSEKSGIVKKIFAKNEHPVEYGSALFEIIE